jgi:ketosteroid isomerase-like protein
MKKYKIIITRIIALLIVFISATVVRAQSSDERAIRQLLDKQTKAWNKGNIDSFMHGYIRSDSLMFIGKNGLKYGYKTTLENYKKSYPDTTAMGKLKFDLLEFKPLSFEYYFVVGKWHLQRTIGDVEGHFTLLFRKVKNKWLIIADHSS